MNWSKQIFFSVLMLLSITAFSQATFTYNNPDLAFNQAKENYMKGNYSIAYTTFKELYWQQNAQSNFPKNLIEEVTYYYLVNALILDDATAVEKSLSYTASQTNAARAQMLYYQLGEYYFRQKQYSKTLEVFAKSNIENLTNSEIATLKFHKAYSHFALQQFKESKPLFNIIRQLPNDPNYIDANYYYGFLCFYDKQYSEALQAFTVAEKDQIYQNVVPFYIAEIHYFTGDKDKALQYAEDALNKGFAQLYDLELKQLVGHLYFDKREYAKALPYLEYYVAKNEKVRREDLYQLSFCYYSTKNYTKSIEGFKQLGGKEDSLAQNSMYLLADAYLKTNDKTNARNAFLFCASNISNKIQKEVSAFNYAKLSEELGYLDIAIKEFQAFFADYPKSAYTNEAKELMFIALANTSNYKDALTLFQSLSEKTETVKKAYPKIVYARAIELLNERQIDAADSLLTIVLTAPYNNNQLQFANFWKGEIAYRNGNIDDAINYYKAYLQNPQTNAEVNEKNAHYNLGYCLFKKENYNNALYQFEQVTKQVAPNYSSIEQDAYLRAADCYFMNKSFNIALKMYDNIIAQNLKSADYAMYQKAIIAGATGKNSEKISLLQNISKQYPNSNLGNDALMEIAGTYLAAEDYTNAITILQQIVTNKDAKTYQPQALLKLGVAYFNLDKNDEALKQFSSLAKNYPNSQEADESIEYIRNIFIETQRPEEFINFMKQNGKLITYSEEDSLTYRSAQIRFQANDTSAALKGFKNYLYKFPDGRYALDANYIAAEITNSNKNKLAALPYYENLANKAPNKYAERSALQAARTYYFDLNNLTKAQQYFALTKQLATQQENKLEAMRGLLRCQYKLQLWSEAEPNAKELLQEKNIATDDKMMANLIIAKSSQNSGKYDEALTAYKQALALGKNEFSAEANYKIAEIQFTQDKLEEAEKTAFAAIKKFGSYEYWLTKNYILLGDIYFKQKDYFNAEATFKSVNENATIAELKTEAQQKLAAVIAEKDKVNKVQTQ